MRVAVVYGRIPSGHASAAQALESHLRARGCECVPVSAASDINPVLGPFLDKLYVCVLESCPWLWRAIYDRRAVSGAAGIFQSLYWRFCAPQVLGAIEKIEPDVIVCTHAAPLAVLALGKARGLVRPKLVACPTDYDVHSFWMSPKVDLYLAPSAFAAGRLAEAGIERARIVETGIPIDEVFATPLDKTQARRGLGLRAQGPVLLLSGGSRGLGGIAQAAEVLLKGCPRAQVAVLCGENKRLWSRLDAAAKSEPRLRAYLRADKNLVRRLMAAADALIGKAGGVTLAEASAAGVPVVFWGALPGQEERNARRWLGAGAAREARSAADLLRSISILISDRAEAAALIENAEALSRPAAGWAAADAVFGLGTLRARLAPPLASAAGECPSGAL